MSQGRAVAVCGQPPARGRLLLLMHARSAATDLFCRSYGAGIYADFSPGMSGNLRPASPCLFDFISDDATNKKCGIFLSKGR
jgi:hypothetical protein